MDDCALFLSHGGGPLPLLGDPGHHDMVANLKMLAGQIKKPSAILLISAHWEETEPVLTAGERSELIYDYYGFPQQSYEIEYPCRGLPTLANKIHEALHNKGFSPRLDPQRGFDHGMFIPLKIMYPKADIPCVQLSLLDNLDPEAHIDMGAALRGVDHEGLLIIGSGFSFHNLRAFFSANKNDADEQNEAFEKWLIATCTDPNLPETQRREKLQNWEQAPYARYCHPREEHLLPLLVCYGAAQTACREHFELNIMHKKASTYLW